MFHWHRQSHSIDYFVKQVEAANDIPVQVPFVSVVADTIKRAKAWDKSSQCLQDSDRHPHYDTLKNLLVTGRDIPIKLDLLAQLESRNAAAKAWIDRALRTFMKKNSTQELMEVGECIVLWMFVYVKLYSYFTLCIMLLKFTV